MKEPLRKPIRHWQKLTTTEVERLVELDPVVVIPIAAIEQHGPHLPLSTDLDIGLGLLNVAFDRIQEDFPVVSLPPIAVGASREHSRFAGTLSIEANLLDELIYQNGVALHRAGVRRIVLSNSHGGNIAALQTAGLRLHDTLDLVIVKTNYFLFPPPVDVDLPSSEWRYGLHGGAIETSMMLHLHPDTVRQDLLTNYTSQAETLESSLRLVRTENSAASVAWLAGELNESGSVGNAELASHQIGEQLVNYYGGKLADVIRDARVIPTDLST